MSLAKGDKCDGCGADLRGAPILAEQQALYGGKTHFSRVIGVEYGYDHPQRYDGVSEWRCPDCGRREGRFTGRVLREGQSEPRPGSG